MAVGGCRAGARLLQMSASIEDRLRVSASMRRVSVCRDFFGELTVAFILGTLLFVVVAGLVDAGLPWPDPS